MMFADTLNGVTWEGEIGATCDCGWDGDVPAHEFGHMIHWTCPECNWEYEFPAADMWET